MAASPREPVYRPSDDTFLLADVVAGYGGAVALEMGVGSGYVTAELARRVWVAVGTDIDLAAVRETRDRLRRSGLANVDLVCCDLASPFRDRPFDLVVFNPPYLPSRRRDDAAVDGGRRGIEAALAFLEHALRVVKESGRLLFVASTLSDYRGILRLLGERGFGSRVVGARRLFFEEIVVIEASPWRGPM